MSIDFWDYEIWRFMIQFSILMIAIVVGNIFIKKVSFLKNSLIPSAVIGGLVLLLLQFIPFFDYLIDRRFMEIVTYHTLGLGFVAITLRKSQEKKCARSVILKTGMATVNTYLIQGILGITVTILFSLTVMPLLFPGSGIIASMGLGRESAHAADFGSIFKDMGFYNGVYFGLSIAAAGFIFACIGGAIAQGVLRKKGMLPTKEESIQYANQIEEPSLNEINVAGCVDKFTMQISFVIGVYFLGYLIMLGLSNLAGFVLGEVGENTLTPLIFGINFVFGVNAALIFKAVMKSLKVTGIVEKDYTNNFMLNRTAGFMFDLMIVAGIAAFEVRNFGLLGLELWIILIIVCSLGGFTTFIYLRKVSKVLFPDYAEAGFFAMFGKLTGTPGTGMMLLKEVDPKLETPAARMLTLQSLPAVIFGIPLLFLIPFAAQGLTAALITLGICILLFVIFNFLIHFQKKTA